MPQTAVVIELAEVRKKRTQPRPTVAPETPMTPPMYYVWMPVLCWVPMMPR